MPVLVIATFFSCLVNFYASVYMAKKKSMLSMLTAAAGAVVNIVLNFILIPRIGAYGAAIATAVSFVVVFVIRAINTKQFVNIKIEWFTFIPSAILLLSSAVVMMLETAGKWQSFAISSALTLLVIIINFRSVTDIIKLLLDKFVKKSGKKA